jgi:hypothetical protein
MEMHARARSSLIAAIDGAALGVAAVAAGLLLIWWMLPF